MNPWAATSPSWYLFQGEEEARQASSLVDAVVEYLDELDLGELDGRLPAVLRVRCCVDDCDNYYGEAIDCAGECDHAVRRYATAFVPLRPMLVRLGWDDDQALMDAIEP